ncbi:hypothetical protein [Pandoraea bronchicola]|uniref:Uncharacterized protein n=1 Tax=Pandoraea bronchicola TaxID=2508287 RepID=A0A5E5BKW1_9BURK|nr:hypothetical protein [Pandoraea bronchicola]VVE86891.1 hypothetical protein PBR20603_00814 [Pandoraea bronchicola]
MTHHSTARSAPYASALRKSLWMTLPGAIAAVLVLAPHAHAQNTPVPANSANAANAAGATGATGSSAFNPSADISRAVSRDTTDAAIQNNWNSIMRPPVQAKSEDKPAETPRRGRRGITPGISTN